MKIDESKLTLESMSQANWYNQWTMNKITPFLKGKILEVGCGIGNFTKSLTKFGQVWAIDINNDYLNLTKEKIGDRVKVGFGDIEHGKYFFQKQKFKCIVCINVLEHIENDDQALKNLFNLLDHKGILILLVPAHQLLFGKIDQKIGHFRRYVKKDIVKRLESLNFFIIKKRKLNFLGGIGWFLASKVFHEEIVSESRIRIFNILAPIFLPFEDIIEPPIGTSILIIAQKKQ